MHRVKLPHNAEKAAPSVSEGAACYNLGRLNYERNKREVFCVALRCVKMVYVQRHNAQALSCELTHIYLKSNAKHKHSL